MATDDRHRPEPLLQRKHPVPQRRRQYRWRQDRSGAHLQSKCRDGDDRQADHTTHQTSHQLRHRLIRRLETKKGLSSPMKYLPGPRTRSVVLGFNFNPMYNFHQYSVPEHRSTYNTTKVPTSRNTKPTTTTRPSTVLPSAIQGTIGQSGYPYGANWSCRSSRSM